MTIHELIQEADGYKDNEVLRKSCINQVVKAIKEQDKLYVMFNEATGYPHVDPKENIWMFSTAQYAEDCRLFFEKEQLRLRAMEVAHDDLPDFLFYCHLWGFERIVIDSGHEAFVVLYRNALRSVEELTEEQQLHLHAVNPNLQRKLLLFFGTLRNGREYKNKQGYLQQLEDNLLREVLKARFIVPVKHDTTDYDSFVVEEDQSEWFPVFSDFSEMSKVYKPDEWDVQFLSYDGVLTAAKDKGISLNRKGMGLWLGQKSKDAIEEFREEEAE